MDATDTTWCQVPSGEGVGTCGSISLGCGWVVGRYPWLGGVVGIQRGRLSEDGG